MKDKRSSRSGKFTTILLSGCYKT